MDSVQVSMENLKVEGGTNNKEEEKRVSDSSEEEEVGIQNADGSVAVALPQEIEEGNIEYKLKLVNPTQDRIEHLISQMKWRLTEGMGEAIYEIGVEDDGNPTGLSEVEMAASIKNLEMMAKQLSADISGDFSFSLVYRRFLRFFFFLFNIFLILFEILIEFHSF
eukprot:TRINITY_DN3079_c0_g1_i5.p1 TRINITY_DN3079_c0_g1~~TRINITY_DN3079_c0_g1_i5.p1  ORF type:complete len:165 (+),score=68.81 TRINITY_DN3079_c0_g1_i5:297-791(+)